MPPCSIYGVCRWSPPKLSRAAPRPFTTALLPPPPPVLSVLPPFCSLSFRLSAIAVSHILLLSLLCPAKLRSLALSRTEQGRKEGSEPEEVFLGTSDSAQLPWKSRNEVPAHSCTSRVRRRGSLSNFCSLHTLANRMTDEVSCKPERQ